MKMPSASFGAKLIVLSAFAGVASAEDQARDAIQKKLEAEYVLTKTTDDKSDIVTAGSVLVLHKDKVLMLNATSTANPCMNTYSDGKIVQSRSCGANETAKKVGRWGSRIPGLGPLGSAQGVASRNFVTGEKFWLTKIDVRSNGVVLTFFTDAINDTRYIGALTIPFGAVTPSPEEALKAVQEIVTVAPAEDAGNPDKGNPQGAPPSGQMPASGAPAQRPATPPATPAAAEAPPPPLDVPPPPPADPVEIKVGQTPEQVVAALGQPLKKAKTSTREIYFYKDLKITFVNGKVKDVE